MMEKLGKETSNWNGKANNHASNPNDDLNEKKFQKPKTDHKNAFVVKCNSMFISFSSHFHLAQANRNPHEIPVSDRFSVNAIERYSLFAFEWC